MSESYNLYSIIPAGLPRADAIYGTHETIFKMGGELDNESSLSLQTREGQEPDVVPIRDVDQALLRLLEWPELGGLDYTFVGITTDVYYYPCTSADLVCAIAVVVRSTLFDSAGPAAEAAFLRLGHLLHDRFRAARTVMGWGLEAMGFDVYKEIERLSRGEFAGSYELLDMRRSQDKNGYKTPLGE